MCPSIAAQLEIDAHYAAYVRRQGDDVDALRRDEAITLPADLDYQSMSGLSAELSLKLTRHRPASLAHAGRLEGMTPAALLVVLAHVKAAQPRKSA